jgi:hypothetical protein
LPISTWRVIKQVSAKEGEVRKRPINYGLLINPDEISRLWFNKQYCFCCNVVQWIEINQMESGICIDGKL